MFTSSNFIEEFAKYEDSMSDSDKARFSSAEKNKVYYGQSDVITRQIDMFCELMNRKTSGMKKNKAEEEPEKPKAESKPKAKKEPKQKQKKEDNSEKVNSILLEVSFIKKYAALNGKTVSEAKERAKRLLASLQKAIISKVIRKTSPYASEIMTIQDSLIKLQSETAGVIEIANVEKYKEIGTSQKVMSSVLFIRSYIALQGKTDVKNKAKALLNRINKAEINDYITEIDEIKNSLTDYIDGETDTPEISSQALNGLFGLAGVECECKSGKAVGSQEFLASVFTPMSFSGKWKSLIGNPTEPFRLMIYGKPGSGKSTLALQFAKYLADEQNRKVLFVAHEEGFGYTLQEKIKRLNIAHHNLAIIDKLPSDLKPYDIIFEDSVNSLGQEPEDLRNLDKKKSFIFVFQTTKEGNFRGSQEFLHDVDTSIMVEDMHATAEKNRFGGNATVRV